MTTPRPWPPTYVRQQISFTNSPTMQRPDCGVNRRRKKYDEEEYREEVRKGWKKGGRKNRNGLRFQRGKTVSAGWTVSDELRHHDVDGNKKKKDQFNLDYT